MTMSKEEVAGILAELEADLKKGAAEAEATLKKAAELPPEDESASASAGGDDSSSPASDPSSAPAPDASAPPAGGPPDAAPAPAAADPAAEQGQALTPEALQAEYGQLPPEELDMHIQAALAAKEALSGAAGPAAPGMPPAGAPAPDAGMPPMPPAMGKADLAINKEANGGKITKNEEKMFAVIKSQQEDIENLSKAIKIVLESPVRKSVTSLSDVPDLKKSETATVALSKKQVDEFIKTNASKMTKSERDLWLQFVDKKVEASKLVPMLERLSSK